MDSPYISIVIRFRNSIPSWNSDGKCAFDWKIQTIRSLIALFLESQSTIITQFPIKNIKLLEFSKCNIGIPMESV